jgi:diguanylate cyclase (GGDEF)-like protein
VPNVVAPGFVIDQATLCIVALFISATGGLLLLFSWAHNRSTPALALWGLGYLTGAVGVMLASGLLAPTVWSACLANMLISSAYAMMWAGSRSFEGRPIHWPLLAAGAVVCIVAFQFDAVAHSMRGRVVLLAVIAMAYMLLNVSELWRARDKELPSRWPTLGLIVLHAAFMSARIPVALTLGFQLNDPRATTAIDVMAFETVFSMFCIVFLRLNMAKERAELELRRAARTDALTGIPNRRAFFEDGVPLLEHAVADRRCAGLMLFDLDRFKQVNDTGGHQTGDRVLRAFADLIAAAAQSRGLVARLGGEEFACLLVGVPMADMLRLADEVRSGFEAQHFPGLATTTTVSAGVAITTDVAGGLPALLAAADRALYRAKAEGRNRVAAAPLALIETTGEASRANAGDGARPGDRSAFGRMTAHQFA